MATVLIHHEVENFDTWKNAFDAGASKREAKGISHTQIGRHNENPNHVYVVFNVDDHSTLIDHLEHGDTKDLQGSGGVVGANNVIVMN